MGEKNALLIKAPAKINLGLEILGRRADGFHDIATLFQAIDLYDDLYFTPAQSGIILDGNRTGLDMGENNLIYRAAKRLLDYVSFSGGVKIRLNKRIPIGAGLGGGSSDAAATLRGLIQLYHMSVSEKEIHNIARSLGADVPFFLRGPIAFGYGIGDILKPSPPLPPCWVVLIKPNFDISTGSIYQKYDLTLTKSVNKIKILETAIESADPKKIGNALFNDLELICISEFPVLADIKKRLLSFGAFGALMTGSGSSVFGLFDDQEKACEAWRSIKNLQGEEEEEVLLCRTILK